MSRREGDTGEGGEARASPEGALIVGLGASAGGLEALEQFFSNLPAEPPLVVLVVQHLDPRRPSMLRELLARWTSLQVVEATEDAQPRPGHVYVIAPGTLLTLERGALCVSRAEEARPGAAIDALFRSLAEDQGERAVGIVLSGAGHDGTAGLRAIKERGGLTLVQSPETAGYGSMPQSAIDAGLADHRLPPAQMPARLAEHARYLAAAGGKTVEEQLAASLGEICALVHERTGHDFSRYKQGTLVRRLRRRMQVHQSSSVADYVRLLGQASGEPEALLKDLLIGVTHFFRDAETFLSLAQQVIPRIVQGKAADLPVRAWVPGCASGEEAYSIAILFREHLERLGARRQVQIFATDLDAELLAEARQGRYPLDIAEHVSPERLARYFVRDGKRYEVVQELREACIFSEHSLIRDPPFSQLDLISCRNVLIYLDAPLQQRLFPLFHYALRPGGFLFLGPSEGIAGAPGLFETEDKRGRIFRRKDAVTRPAVEFPLAGRGRARAEVERPSAPAPRAAAAPTPLQKIGAAFEHVLRDEYTLPAAVIDARGEALFVAGPLGRYLQLPAGPAAMPNLLDGLIGPLRLELRAALRAAKERGRRVVRENVVVELEEAPRTVRLIVRPMPAVEAEAGLFLAVIQEGAAAAPASPDEGEVEAGAPAVEHLESELRTTRAELKVTVEELESANEELKSGNEELISTNEELQSANEELQVSKEELQSLNEELETVNAELRHKVDELASANSDLQNVFAATEIATLFLDRSLRLARFTPAATALLHLIDADVGRPLSDLAPRFAGHDLVADAREVLRLLKPIERQVQSAEGAWFVLRVLPYRTTENVISGVSLTLVDVSEMKRAEESTRRQAQLLHLSHDAILVWRFDGGIESWNRGAQDLYGYRPEEAAGRAPHELLATTYPKPRAEIEQELRSGGCWVGELQHRTRDGRAVTVLSNLQWVRGDDGVDRVLEANRDITERKAAERRLAYLASFPENNPNPIVEADAAGRVRYANPTALRLFPELVAQGAAHPWLADWRAEFQRAWETGGALSARAVEVGGRTYHQELAFLPAEDVIRAYGLDITERRRAEETLRESEERFRTLASNAQDFIARFDRDLRYLYVNPAVERQTGTPLEGVRGKTVAESGRGADFAAAWNDRLRQALDTGEPLRFEWRAGDRWYDVQLSPELEGDVVASVLSVARDITEQKKAHEALRESERLYRAIGESIDYGVWVCAPDGRTLYASESFLKLVGHTREQTAGFGWADAMHPDDVEATLAAWRECLRTGAPWSREHRFRGADGQWHPVLGRGVPVRDEQGKILFWAGINLDIGQLRQAERALQESEQRYAAIHDHAPFAIALTRMPEVTLVSVNAAFLELLEYRAEEVLGKTSVDLGIADEASRELVAAELRRRGSVRDFEVERVARSGAVRVLSLNLDWVGIDGERMVLTTIQDVTQRKRAEEGLREANERLQEADRRKNEFLAALSHELRNPLTPIRNSLYILERSAQGSDQSRRAQEVIGRQTGQLARLVDDLLEVTRVSRNKIQLQRQPLDLNDLVRRAVEDHRTLFEERGIALETSWAPGRLTIDGDAARLGQVVGNLLHNAAKFTPSGGRVRVATEELAPAGRAALRVVDTGAGMEPAMLLRLFQPFMQAEMTLDRSRGGLGLGLALVKGLVEMHGGEVSAHSDGPGKGAEFVVELPLHAGGPAPEAAAPRAAGRRSRRVLIVEDNTDAADSLREALELGGHAVEVAYDGAEGLAKAREFKPEVVLCDIGLPGMDGYAVARAFRADPALQGIALIALSGYALREDQQRALEAGFHRHLAKPASLEALQELLSELPDRGPS